MERLTERDFNFTTDYIKSSIDSWSIAQCLKKLQEYEDAEEQGLLLKLQLNVGDIVYEGNNRYTITGYSFGTGEDFIDEPVVEDQIVYYYKNSNGSITGCFSSDEIGKTVFPARKEEAEQALAEMKKN